MGSYFVVFLMFSHTAIAGAPVRFDICSRYLRGAEALNDEQIRKLTIQYRSASAREKRQIAEKVIRSHARIVYSLVRRWAATNPELEFEDLYQEAVLVIPEAIERYRATRGKFATHLVWRLRSALSKAAMRGTQNVHAGMARSDFAFWYRSHRTKAEKDLLRDGIAVNQESLGDYFAQLYPEDAQNMREKIRDLELSHWRGRPDSLERPLALNQDFVLGDTLRAPDKSVDEQVGAREELSRVAAWFEEFSVQLKPTEHLIFWWRIVPQMTDVMEPWKLRELADEVGVSAERVNQIQHKLESRFKAYLEAKGVGQSRDR